MRVAAGTWFETPILSGSVSSGIFSAAVLLATRLLRLAATTADVKGSVRVRRIRRIAAPPGKLAEQGPAGFRSGVEIVDGRTWVARRP